MIRQDARSGVTLLALNHPPSNVLTLQMRRDLEQALSTAIADPETKAIVLSGLGDPPAACLSAGLDMREAAQGFASPTVSDLCHLIETSETPVVAVLHGVTSGAGVELALAAHARIGTGGASVGFPDVIMGLCPGAGATQRLPRFLGAQYALDLLLSQHPRLLRVRQLRPLVDRMLPEEADPLAAAVELAVALADDLAQGGTLRRSCDLRDGLVDFAANASAIAARRAQVAASPNFAGARIVDCVEAACLLPFEAGLAFEAVAHQDLLASDLSKALRHATFAAARAGQMPELTRASPQPVACVALVGGGGQAAQLAAACLVASLRVVHFERSDTALSALSERIKAALAMLVKSGRADAAAVERDFAHWHGTTALSELVEAEVLIETVADSLPTKMQVMAALDRVAGQGAVFVTTSALLGIDEIAAAISRPAAVLGLRLPAPAHISRLAEVIPGAATSDQAVATIAAMLRGGMHRIVLRSGTGGGGLGEPILAALQAAAAGMLRLGATPERIDSALQDYGFAHGIFRQMDMLGLETVLARGQVAARQVACGTAHLDDLDRLVMAGRTGLAAGRGYYIWQDGQPQPDRAVTAMLDVPVQTAGPSTGQQAGAPMVNLSDEAIVLRAIAAMANAGARAVRAGLALRPSDMDTVMIEAHGYPRWHGGPMKAADLVGLFDVQRALQRFAADDPALYTADPCFAALVREGLNFDSLNAHGAGQCIMPG